MGRPKGSRNKRAKRVKRKYRRRATAAPVDNGSSDEVYLQARALTAQIKAELADADAAVAKIAITDLIGDLQVILNIGNGNPPAP